MLMDLRFLIYVSCHCVLNSFDNFDWEGRTKTCNVTCWLYDLLQSTNRVANLQVPGEILTTTTFIGRHTHTHLDTNAPPPTCQHTEIVFQGRICDDGMQPEMSSTT